MFFSFIISSEKFFELAEIYLSQKTCSNSLYLTISIPVYLAFGKIFLKLKGELSPQPTSSTEELGYSCVRKETFPLFFIIILNIYFKLFICIFCI